MPKVSSNGIELHYESFGSAKAPAMLLIMGLGCQMLRWHLDFCNALVDRGYRVIRFDNRDCGLSTRCEALPMPDLRAMMLGGTFSPLPYTLDTLAADSVGLLDALGIDRAHIVGASMGGAVAQIVAARYPKRTLSLSCLMASSGNPMLPPPTAAAASALFAPLPASRERAALVADAVTRYLAVASPGYPTPKAEVEAMFGAEFDRGFYPQGVARQLAALIAHGDRRPLLAQIACPVSVLHGKADPLIPFACGEDIARHIPQARLWPFEGMGHDLPRALTPQLVEAIVWAAG